jgi:hypothetical protein
VSFEIFEKNCYALQMHDFLMQLPVVIFTEIIMYIIGEHHGIQPQVLHAKIMPDIYLVIKSCFQFISTIFLHNLFY